MGDLFIIDGKSLLPFLQKGSVKNAIEISKSLFDSSSAEKESGFFKFLPIDYKEYRMLS
jgi:hypothetical protein